MATGNYDLAPLAELVNFEYTPQQISEHLDEVLHYYVLAKLASGESCEEDAAHYSTVRHLQRVLSTLRTC